MKLVKKASFMFSKKKSPDAPSTSRAASPAQFRLSLFEEDSVVSGNDVAEGQASGGGADNLKQMRASLMQWKPKRK